MERSSSCLKGKNIEIDLASVDLNFLRVGVSTTAILLRIRLIGHMALLKLRIPMQIDHFNSYCLGPHNGAKAALLLSVEDLQLGKKYLHLLILVTRTLRWKVL